MQTDVITVVQRHIMVKEVILVMGKNQHVTHREDGTWQVIGDGNSKATAITRTQANAIKIARNIAINQESEVVIHRPNGKIRDKNSYGNDPYPPSWDFVPLSCGGLSRKPRRKWEGPGSKRVSRKR